MILQNDICDGVNDGTGAGDYNCDGVGDSDGAWVYMMVTRR